MGGYDLRDRQPALGTDPVHEPFGVFPAGFATAQQYHLGGWKLPQSVGQAPHRLSDVGMTGGLDPPD
jgi:hypothetical protein